MSDADSDDSSPPPTSLSEAENQDIQHLREIAGGIDFSEALKLMNENDWNLERAVHKLMGFEDTIVRQRSVPQVELVPPNQRILRTSDAPHGWLWSALLLLLRPIQTGYSLVVGIFRFFSSFIWPDPRTQVTDPIGDVRRFIWHFKSSYGPSDVSNPTTELADQLSNPTIESWMPPFFVGSYAEAVQEAKRNLKFLVVYLHSDSHEDTHNFCKSTLQSEPVLQFLRNSDELIFWGCNIESPEGYRVSRTLREHTYPFVGVIGLSNIPISDNGILSGTTTRMALLGRIEGALEPIELVNQLSSILTDHQAVTVTARTERNERELTARLRLEQDQAYAESLAQDRAKEAARQAEKQNADLQAAKLAQETKRREALANARKLRQQRWQRCLPPEPESKEGLTVRLSLKMPHGTRVSRIFSIHDSVKLLYYFVLSQEDAPDAFEIQSNFPKRVLNCQPADESDIEDYIPQTDSNLANGPHQSGSGEPENKIVYDWLPRSDKDPPSFLDLELTSSQLLYVLDKDA